MKDKEKEQDDTKEKDSNETPAEKAKKITSNETPPPVKAQPVEKTNCEGADVNIDDKNSTEITPHKPTQLGFETSFRTGSGVPISGVPISISNSESMSANTSMTASTPSCTNSTKQANVYNQKKGSPNDFGEEERKKELTLSEKKKKQIEEKKALNATKDFRSIAKNWDLNTPPSERHEFWSIPDPKIKYEALIHYVHTNQKVTIPYDYVALGYGLWVGQEKYVPKEGEKRPTIKSVLNDLNEVLESEHYAKQTIDPDLESKIKYTPKITAWNQEIAKLEGNLDKNKKHIHTCEGSMKEEE